MNLDLTGLSAAGRDFVITAYQAAKVVDDDGCRMLSKGAEALIDLAERRRPHLVTGTPMKPAEPR